MKELENVKMEIQILNHVKELMEVMNFSRIEELEDWLMNVETYLNPENIKMRQGRI